MSIKQNAKSKPELTIIVNTCDAYSDVLHLFFAAFSEYWPSCRYEVVVNTENNTHKNFPARINNYKSGKFNSWGDRLLQTLSNVESEFVMVVYDDFIVESPIDEEKIELILRLMKADSNAAVYYLVKTNLPVSELNNNDSNFCEIVDNSDFRLNSFPAIWRKSDLINYTGVNDNPWAWEVFGSYRTFNDGRKFYSLNSSGKDIYPYNYNKGGAIYRGKWVRSVVSSKLVKYNLNINTSLRGFAEDAVSEGRKLSWMIQFMITGFKMVGFRSFRFIPRYIKAKYYAGK